MDEAKRIERANIGYWASTYLPWSQTVKMYDLFATQSPVFGKDFPDPHRAFWAGVALALEQRGRRMRPEELNELRLWTHDVHRWKRIRRGR